MNYQSWISKALENLAAAQLCFDHSHFIEFCISNVTSISKINLMRVYRPEGVFENHLSF